MLKVLYLPLGSQPTTSAAFRNSGVDLAEFDFYTSYNKVGREETARIFLEHVAQIKPDLAHMQLQFEGMIDPDVLVKAKELSPNTIFTNWSGDIYKTVVQYFVDVSKVIDYSFLSNTGQIPLYLAAGGKNIIYWQIGYPQQMFKPLNKTEFKYKVAFTANNYPDTQYPDAKLRRDIMRSLRMVFGKDAGLFGRNYSHDLGIHHISPSQLNEIYNDSVCVLSVSNFNDISDYFSDRLLYCIGSGRPAIVYRFPGLDKYFKNGKDILVVNNINEIIAAIIKLNNDRELANVIGASGSKRALAEHTLDAKIVELLSIVGLRMA
jgi:spore maturation protein CgeB